MLGGSPRGGDGTNVVLNEGSARWLGVCIGKRIPVVVVVASVRCIPPIFFGGSEISVGGGVEWRWATAAVATAAVALRAEVSRGQRRCVELMKTVSLDREKPLFPVLSSALFGY